MAAPKFKEMERAYGFEEVAIVPGDITVNPDQTNTEFKIGNFTFSIPVLAAAMDAVVDPDFAILLHKLGGLAVLNLDGVQARYNKPEEVLAKIVQASDTEVTSVLQKIYSEPIKEKLVGERIQTIKKAGAICAVSLIPANTKQLAPVVKEAGADILVIQSTVTTARHISKSYRGLIFSELCQTVGLPIIVGNCVTYSAALELMRTGIDGLRSRAGIAPTRAARRASRARRRRSFMAATGTKGIESFDSARAAESESSTPSHSNSVVPVFSSCDCQRAAA